MKEFITLDTQQLFSTIAQVIPVLVIALVVEASQPWIASTLPWRRKFLIVMAAFSEMIALIATAFRVDALTPSEPGLAIVLTVAALFCLMTVSILVAVLARILIRAVNAAAASAD